MKIGNRFSLVVLALISISGAGADPLKVQTSPPEPWTTPVGDPRPAAAVRLVASGRIKAKAEQLWLDDRLIFEAKAIDGRSVSGPDPATALWAVSAVTGDRPPMTGEGEGLGPDIVMRDGKEVLDASPREIWLVTPDGKSRRLSKPDMDATGPLISPDGKYVAFSGRQLNPHGVPGPQAAYLASVASGEIVELAHMETPRGSYSVAATRWTPDSRSITLSEEWGEVGGQGALRTVTLLP